LGISQSELARHIGVHHFVVCNLVHGKRNVTPRIAMMLANALGTSAEFWMGLQADYDVTSLARTEEGKRVATIQKIARAM
jgi:addiction module HigA family antidote